MTKSLDTLIDDIYTTIHPEKENPNGEIDESVFEEFGEAMKEMLRTRLSPNGGQPETRSPLRFSGLGTPDRKLWYQANRDKFPPEEMTGKTYLKFMYGDVLEVLLLALVKASGHKVEAEQQEVEVGGVKGHVDVIIDGVTVDVKSASPFGFKKFKDHSIFENDAFGYIPQLAGYSSELTPDEGAAFLAFDKVSGELCITKMGQSIIEANLPAPTVEHQKSIIASETPPERCYDDIPDGASGNRKLDTPCSYCNFKHHCWPEMRTFLYSNGPRFLTVVKKRPQEHIREV